MQEENNMTLSLSQQHLLSYFTLVPVVSVKRLFEMFDEIVNRGKNQKPVTLELLYREISLINQIIHDYDLEITASVDELSSQKLFVLVNTSENSVTQKTKFYDKNTNQLFSKIIQDCVLSEEGHLSETHCLNLSSQVGISKSTAQTTLEKFVQDKWIVSKEGRISLGMRSIVELERNIKQQYPDEVKCCPFCKLLILQGYICRNCKLRSHYACLKTFFKLPKSNCICPTCKEVWNDLPELLQNMRDDTPTEEEFESPVPAKRRRKS